jgi:NhaC family Na+:H+ antiporter
MEHAGFLERLLQPIVAHAPTRGRLIAAVNGSGIGLNVIAGDQYVADVLPARMFRGEFERRGLAPQVLSRAVEDSGTVTSVLVPWNTCGAYISGVLGVSTASYFPYCFFNLLSPVLDVAYGFLGFKVPSVAPPVQPGGPQEPHGDPAAVVSESLTPAGRSGKPGRTRAS